MPSRQRWQRPHPGLSVAFRSVDYLKQIFKPNQQNFEYASTVAIYSSKTKSSTPGRANEIVALK
jgi:hypothetical protein